MTTNDNTYDITPLASLMGDILEGDLPDVDILDLLALLKPIVPGPVYESLMLAFAMCPIHTQDLDSCADDDEPNETIYVNDELPPLAACRHLRPRA